MLLGYQTKRTKSDSIGGKPSKHLQSKTCKLCRAHLLLIIKSQYPTKNATKKCKQEAIAINICLVYLLACINKNCNYWILYRAIKVLKPQSKVVAKVTSMKANASLFAVNDDVEDYFCFF